MSTNQNASLLDSNIEDLKEVAGFEVPVPGIYNLLATMGLKEINNEQCVELAIVVVDCAEQDDPTATATLPGTKSSMLFKLSNEYSVSDLKKILKPFGEHFGVSNVRQLVEECVNDVQIVAKIGNRKGKAKNPGDAAPVYMTLSNITVL
jgi:hypothetical protein